MVEVLLIPEPGIYSQVVDGVVTVGLGREDRSEQQARAAKLHRVVQPSLQLPQPVPDRLPHRQRCLLRAGEAQGVNVPPDNGLWREFRERASTW